MLKNAFLFAFLMSVLLSSCQALHRGIPKADRHADRRVVSIEDRSIAVVAVTPDEQVASADLRTAPLAAERDPETIAATTEIPDTEIRRRIFVDPEDDTLVIASDTPESDEAILNEAMESERVARSAYGFSFVPLLTLLFFPALFVGIIVTLIKLAKFNRYQYVTEKGLDYERRAKRTLILSSVIPILVVVLFILMILVLF